MVFYAIILLLSKLKMFTLDAVVHLVETYKYAILLPVSTVEGPAVSLVTGFLCSLKILNIAISYGILLAGDMIGDTIYYSIGRFGGRRFIRKWGHYFSIDEEKVVRMERRFERHAGKILLIGKTQAIGGIALVSAGLAKMPYWKYMWFNLVGSLVKVALFLTLGYYFGKSYSLVNGYLGVHATITTAILVLAVIAYFVIKRIKKS